MIKTEKNTQQRAVLEGAALCCVFQRIFLSGGDAFVIVIMYKK